MLGLHYYFASKYNKIYTIADMGFFKKLFSNNKQNVSSSIDLNQPKDKLFLEINMRGKELEKEKRIDEAINVYELGVKRNSDTPHTYKRLAILYSKRNDKENELRIIKIALSNIQKSSSHIEWFRKRKSKFD